MKFLEVKLRYMNTNLVQENFSRCSAAPGLYCPQPHVSKASVLWGQWHAGNPFGDFLGGCSQRQGQEAHCLP